MPPLFSKGELKAKTLLPYDNIAGNNSAVIARSVSDEAIPLSQKGELKAKTLLLIAVKSLPLGMGSMSMPYYNFARNYRRYSSDTWSDMLRSQSPVIARSVSDEAIPLSQKGELKAMAP